MIESPYTATFQHLLSDPLEDLPQCILHCYELSLRGQFPEYHMIIQRLLNICSGAGGLGDVMSALPKALSRRGHRVMAIAPRYENYEEGWETGSRIRVKVFDQEQEVRRHPLLWAIFCMNILESKNCLRSILQHENKT